MNNLLIYLNSADVDTLIKTPGITRPLAESLIAARPFETVEDCLKVRGMGKALLARMQSTLEATEKPSEGQALIAVQEEAAPMAVEASQPRGEPPAPEGPSVWSRLGGAFLNIFRAVVRFIAFVIVVGAIGAAVYFGVPYVRDNFIVPMERNSTQIENLRTEITELQQKNADLQAQLEAMGVRVDALEQTIAAHTASLEQLAEMQATIDANMQAADEKLAAQVQAGDEQLMRDLKRDIALTRSIEYLSRARLYLSQSNFGLALADVQAARDLLAEIQANEPEFKAEAMKQVLARLDLALSNLPAFPVIAVADVDIALGLLLNELPEGQAEPTATPTPVVESTLPPTPTLVVDMTPTPTMVP